jgi:hypothetical protein
VFIGGVAGTGVDTVAGDLFASFWATGYPQRRHAGASDETSVPHSGQGIRAMEGI